MWLTLALVAIAAYGGVVTLVALSQTRMIFPVEIAAAGAVPTPPGAHLLQVEAPDGIRLAAVHVPGKSEGKTGTAVLGFGGNAWDASAMARLLHDLYPQHDVVAVHYRGYGPSGGRPGAEAILADALTLHDHVAVALQAERVVAVGFSIGAGPATNLAARRPLAGLVLVSPFDSLEALARHHYPWAPVGLLLRHRMPVAALVRRSEAPVALIAAGRDTIVPPARTAPVRAAIPELVLDRTVSDADHNDVYDRPEFEAAMREAMLRIEDRRGRP